jgi:hypothetical protein
MKLLVIALLTCKMLFGASLFTLDHLKNVRLYFINDSDFIDKAHEESIKEHLITRLKEAGFVFGERDSSTFFLKIESLKVAKSEVVYIQIGVGEQIVTKRKDNIESFSFTYLANDFIESSAAYNDTMESINFLLDEFIEAYHEDNE